MKHLPKVTQLGNVKLGLKSERCPPESVFLSSRHKSLQILAFVVNHWKQCLSLQTGRWLLIATSLSRWSLTEGVASCAHTGWTSHCQLPTLGNGPGQMPTLTWEAPFSSLYTSWAVESWEDHGSCLSISPLKVTVKVQMPMSKNLRKTNTQGGRAWNQKGPQAMPLAHTIPGVTCPRGDWACPNIHERVDWREVFIGRRRGKGWRWEWSFHCKEQRGLRTPGHHAACVTCREEQEAVGWSRSGNETQLPQWGPPEMWTHPFFSGQSPCPQFQPRPGGISLGNHSLWFPDGCGSGLKTATNLASITSGSRPPASQAPSDSSSTVSCEPQIPADSQQERWCCQQEALQ